MSKKNKRPPEIKMNALTEYGVVKYKEVIESMYSKGVVIQNTKPKEPMRISFDFDHTLSEQQMQDLCRKFIKLGAEVWVVTSRSMTVLGKDTNNDDLYEVTDSLNIPRERVLFTAYEDKYSFVKDMDFHIDDSYDEIFLINQYPGKTIGFLYETKFHDNGIKEF